MFRPEDHTFAICAYGDSPYLVECVESLISQSVSTNLIMTSSTPNDHIREVAQHYRIPLFINPVSKGIAADWNFSYARANTSLVTIAHQDDTYAQKYTEHMLQGLNAATRPLVFFTDYGELRNGVEVDNNRLLRIKRLLLAPLKKKTRQNSAFWKRRVLSLGSAICCPSVTFVKENLPNPLFREGLETNLDWDAWERLSRENGAFIYDSSLLMHHRVHEESATTLLIEGNVRKGEDELMLGRFWPKPIAKAINIFYSQGQKSNRL